MGCRNLVVSDVDGTLLGDDDALARLRDWHQAHAHQVTLVYSSGRFYRSVLESIETTLLPAPTAIIGGVGTDVHLFGQTAPLADWHRTFERWNAERARAALGKYSELVPQPEEFQSPHKLSYYAYDLTDDFLENLKETLREAVCDANVVYSSQRDLDILPAGANKGTAAAFLAAQLGFAAEEVIVCGDSGNDLAMFQQLHFRGVVVGNAHPELKSLNSDRVYQAQACFAAGVLEGLWHWQERSAEFPTWNSA